MGTLRTQYHTVLHHHYHIPSPLLCCPTLSCTSPVPTLSLSTAHTASLLPTFYQPHQTTAEPTPFFNCKYQSKGRGVWGEGHEKYLYFIVKHFFATSNFITLFHEFFDAHQRPSTPQQLFCFRPRTPKQRHKREDVLGSDFGTSRISHRSLFSSSLWRKDWFSTPVQLGSKSENGQFSTLFGPGP